MSLQLIVVLILVGGWLMGRLFSVIGLPGVLGMTLWGVALGMLWRNVIPPELWAVAPFLKSLALITILLRAGLGIKMDTLRKVGSVTLRMAFFPALIEASVLSLLFHFLVGFSWPLAATAACLLSAVSPAVVVPSMLSLKEKGYGKENEIPTIVLAGASLDDVLMITLFSLFLAIAQGESTSLVRTLLSVPWAIVAGMIPGLLLGFALVWFFGRFHHRIRATEKTLLLLGLSVMLLQLGDWTHAAALLGIMTVGFVLLEKAEEVAAELSGKLNRLWVFSEIILFVLIGLSVDPRVAFGAGFSAVGLIAAGLVARSLGVLLAFVGTGMPWTERAFAVIAYWPKATVQAALGAVVLEAGIPGGDVILAYAVMAILITAPLGLLGIRTMGPRLLSLPLESETAWTDAD